MMTLPYTPLPAGVRHAEEDGPLAEALDGHAGRLLLAAQPGRAGLRRRSAGLRSPTSSSAAARCRSRSRTGSRAEGARALERRGRRRAVPRRRRRTASTVPRRSPGRRRRATTRSSARSARGSSAPARALGHGGLAAAEAANAAAALGGRPVLAARVSEGDPRERHRGVSHHTRTVLDLCLARSSSPGRRRTPRAGEEAAPACRSRTWAAARTRTRRSSAAAYAAGRRWPGSLRQLTARSRTSRRRSADRAGQRRERDARRQRARCGATRDDARALADEALERPTTRRGDARQLDAISSRGSAAASTSSRCTTSSRGSSTCRGSRRSGTPAGSAGSASRTTRRPRSPSSSERCVRGGSRRSSCRSTRSSARASGRCSRSAAELGVAVIVMRPLGDGRAGRACRRQAPSALARSASRRGRRRC